MKVPYQEIGVVNTKEVFKKAMEGGYAVPAYNFNNMEQLQAIIIGCAESKSPVILQVSKGARDYANQTLLRYMAMGAVQMAREMDSKIPITLHLDHGDSFDLCKSCVESDHGRLPREVTTGGAYGLRFGTCLSPIVAVALMGRPR